MKLILIIISIVLFMTFIITLVALSKARKALKILYDAEVVKDKGIMTQLGFDVISEVYPVSKICKKHKQLCEKNTLRIELLEDYFDIEFVDEHTCGPELRSKKRRKDEKS